MNPDIGLVNFQWAIRWLLRENKRYEEKKQSGRSTLVSNRTHVASVRDASRGKRTLGPLGISVVTLGWTEAQLERPALFTGNQDCVDREMPIVHFYEKGKCKWLSVGIDVSAANATLRIGLVRGATPRGASNFSALEANASADLDLSVASWFLLRRASIQCSETIWP